MGKAARWFRGIFGKKDPSAEDRAMRKRQDQRPVPRAAARRWSFGKSSQEAAAAGGDAAAIAPAAWLGSAELERERRDHAVAMAAATAAAADAARAAAAAVVRFTGKGRRAAAAAVRIQTTFRGFLARKALRAFKALVKLQALVRGYLVRRQTAAALRGMQALVRAQAAVRARRAGVAELARPHRPPVRPRYSLQQERYADDSRSERGAAACSSRRLSASIGSSSHGFDRSPKIVEVDPGRPKSSRSSSCRASTPLVDAGSGEEWGANPASSPLPCYLFAGPQRVAVASSRQFPDYDCCAPEKARSATAQSTPRYACAPPTPTNCRGYMSGTQSSEARARSQSAPKQRPELMSPNPKKRVPLSEVVLVVEPSRASVGTHRASCTRAAAQETFSFQTAAVGRKDRMLEVTGENDRLAF